MKSEALQFNQFVGFSALLRFEVGKDNTAVHLASVTCGQEKYIDTIRARKCLQNNLILQVSINLAVVLFFCLIKYLFLSWSSLWVGFLYFF